MQNFQKILIYNNLVWKSEATNGDSTFKTITASLSAARAEKQKLMQEWKSEIDAQRDNIDKKQAEDKLNDRGFKAEFEREFETNAVIADSLAKIYRRRPKQGETIEQLDEFSDPPAGVELPMWELMVNLRHEKLRQEAAIRHEQFKPGVGKIRSDRLI